MPEHVILIARGPDGNDRIVEVDANGRLYTAGGGVGGITQVEVLPGEIHMGQVGGATEIAIDSYTRPANTTQYASGDQVADGVPSVLEFAVSRVVGGTGVIIYAIYADSANQATNADLHLYLFDTTPTIVADNLAWTPSDGDMVNLIGMVDFSAWEIGLATAGAGGNCA
ncbi:unnamed protein product, partial [marine sediment metagenome]